jgi:hypothetical protein
LTTMGRTIICWGLFSLIIFSFICIWCFHICITQSIW